MLSGWIEDSLMSISVDSFVPVLVGLLNHESNPAIMLLAARALTCLCDVLPSSCSAVVRYGAIPCFCARLLTIEYMELAEQSLEVLRRISQEHPTTCLRAGALMAVLSYLDLFSTGVQRVALSTAANMCKKLPSDAADFVMEAVPLLTNLLNYHDSKVVEHASVCLTRVAEAFASSPDKLDELCNHGLVAQASGLISLSNSGGQASLSASTCTGLIRLLLTCASGSPLVAKTLLRSGISSTLKDILVCSGLVSGSSVSPTMTRPPEQVDAIVNLVDVLLPSMPQGNISLPIPSNILVKGPAAKSSPVSNSGKHDEPNGTTNEVSAHGKLLQDQPELLQQFGIDLLPVLLQVYPSSINSAVRHRCFSIIGKLMYFSSAEMIQSYLGVANISSFLAGILAWKDPQLLIPGLQITEILMEKLPGTFSKIFVREGVVHAVDALISSDSSSSVPSLPPILEKDTDPLPGMSWCSQCNRQRGCGLNTENISIDDSKGSSSEISGSPPSSVEIPNHNSSLQAAASSLAKSFKDKYFPADPGATEAGLTEDLLRLKNLCSKLNSIVETARKESKGKSKASGVGSFDISASYEEQLGGVIAEMLTEISKGDGVSTFEFIGSGVIWALLDYFSCGTFGKEKTCQANLPKFQQQALQRYKSFIAKALPMELKDGKGTPMSCLIQKLQTALSSLDHFPVVIGHSSRSSSGSTHFSSGPGVSCQPLKLRLCRAQGEKSLHDYSSNVLVIDKSITLAAVEEFLWPIVKRSESAQKPPSAGNCDSGAAATGSVALTSLTRGHRPSTRSRSSFTNGVPAKKDASDGSANSSKGKGKSVLKSAADEARGPQISNAVHRRAALDKDNETKPALGESSSEVLRYVTLPVCIIPNKVHDIKLESSEGLAAVGGRGVRVSQEYHGLTNNNSISSDHHNKLIFSAGGKQLSNKDFTVYYVLQQILDEEDDEKFNGSDLPSDGISFRSDIFTITYQKADGQADNGSQGCSNSSKSSKNSSASDSTNNNRWQGMSLLDSILQGELPCDLEKPNPTYNILALLRVLDSLNHLSTRLRTQAVTDDFSVGQISDLDKLYIIGPKILPEDFVNSKLTAKLARQTQDAFALCSGSLPPWCYQLTKACPFLFPFETRRLYFHSTAFGISRALYRLQENCDNQNSTSEREVRVGRLQRQKVRVSRNRILDSAVKVMEMYPSQIAVLEVQYFGEVGTGLGPTLEFYTLLSHDLQKVELGLWRCDSVSVNSAMQIDGDETDGGKNSDGSEAKKVSSEFPVGRRDLVQAPNGLFPRPWPPAADASDVNQLPKVIENFRLVGWTMAKALQDGRLLDFPLSTAFYKLILGQELELHDILLFDAEFGKILQEMQALVHRKQFIDRNPCNNHMSTDDLRFRGAPVEDLCLDFTLPGYPEYILKEGGENIMVDLNNLDEYVTLVVDATIKTGIMRQMEAFRASFNQVFEISSLQIFSPPELDTLIYGRRELWVPETLVDHIKFDHGYTAESPVIVNLLEIMGEFSLEQQRAFCHFVTGAPGLPHGGLAALNPKLTVVRKHSSASANAKTKENAASSGSADKDLPSVMTCANYLKLPPYSTKDIMYKKLLYAINEGRGSFDMS